MSENWYVLSVFGKDQCGIVARISQSLFELEANMCETSMCRLGDYFTILAFVDYAGDVAKINHTLQSICDSMQLRFHLDALSGHQHQHSRPDMLLHFHGSDRRGLVAKISSALSQANINILDLQSDVAGSATSRQFVMTIEADAGSSNTSADQLKKDLKQQGIDVIIEDIDTMMA